MHRRFLLPSLIAAVSLTIAAQTERRPVAPEITDVELGRLLFWDPILSGEKDVSCATCHHPDFAYADGRDLSLGVGSVGIGPFTRRPFTRTDPHRATEFPNRPEHRLQRR